MTALPVTLSTEHDGTFYRWPSDSDEIIVLHTLDGEPYDTIRVPGTARFTPEEFTSRVLEYHSRIDTVEEAWREVRNLAEKWAATPDCSALCERSGLPEDLADLMRRAAPVIEKEYGPL